MKTVKLTDGQHALVKVLLTKIHDDQTNFWEIRGKGGYANSTLEQLGRALKAFEEAENPVTQVVAV